MQKKLRNWKDSGWASCGSRTMTGLGYTHGQFLSLVASQGEAVGKRLAGCLNEDGTIGDAETAKAIVAEWLESMKATDDKTEPEAESEVLPESE